MKKKLKKLREIVTPELANKIFFTTNNKEALEKVSEQRDNTGRTVVVSSVFRLRLDSEPLPAVIRRADNDAWYFAYLRLPVKKTGVLGVIDKNVEDHRKILEFLSQDFDTMTLKTLRRRLPWLE